MSQTSKLSPYRWVIETLLLLLLTAQSFAWLAPAPILQEISNGLGISLSSAGLIISIIALCIGIFSLLGAVVSERIGPLRALIIGIWLMAIGQIASGYCAEFRALLACRVLEGVGYGLVIAPPGTLTMQWFGEGEWPYINMVNFSFGYVGLTAVFRATPALFAAVGSWRMTLLWYGVGSAGVALLWSIFGREHRTESQRAAPGAIEAPAERGLGADGSREDAQRAADRGRTLRRDVGLPDLYRVPARVLPQLPRHVARRSLDDDAGAAVHGTVRGVGRRNRHGDVGTAQTVHVANRVRDADRMRRRNDVSRPDVDSRCRWCWSASAQRDRSPQSPRC